MHWGPSFWNVLHFTAHRYVPSKHRQYLMTLLTMYSDPEYLPGAPCARNFASMLAEVPPEPYLNTREGAITYINYLHNRVNQRLGKPLVSIAEARQKYDKVSDKDTYQSGIGEIAIGVGGLFILLGALI